MKKVFTMMMAAILLSLSTATYAQKIAVVSPDEIFSVLPDVKKADSSLKLYQKALSDDYGDREAELNSAMEKFFKDSSKMTKEIKDAKRTSLQKKIQELQGSQEDINKQIEEKKSETLKPIQDKILKAVQDVAKENGYVYVLYREQTIVFPEAEDITNKVKAKLGVRK